LNAFASKGVYNVEIPPPKHHSEQFLKLVEDAKTRVHEISIAEYRRMVRSGDAGQLIDVREDHEWAGSHAQGAIHLSKGIIERDIEKMFPDKSTKLVLYCGGGFRSALTADNIQKMGYTNVLSLDGGWRAILEAGLPVTEDTPAD
jgi:rhodanese-related sulfurtransferase